MTEYEILHYVARIVAKVTLLKHSHIKISLSSISGTLLYTCYIHRVQAHLIN